MSTEITTPMRAVKISRLCSHCQQGMLAGVRQVGEDKYENVCPSCKYTELHPVSYPYMRFEETKQ